MRQRYPEMVQINSTKFGARHGVRSLQVVVETWGIGSNLVLGVNSYSKKKRILPRKETVRSRMEI